MDSINLESPPSTPTRIRLAASPIFAITTAEAPRSPAAAYRMQRQSADASESYYVDGVDTTTSPTSKKILKKARILAPPACSLCRANCTKNRGVSIGARVAIAVGVQHFPRGLNGLLFACDTCYRAMHRAQPLLLELEKIVIKAPSFDGAAAQTLRQLDYRKVFSTLHTTFEINRLNVEAILRQLPPSNEWSILPAFCGGYLQLIKNSSDNKYGVVELCSVNRSNSMVTVQDPIARRPFNVPIERIIPVPDAGVTAGVAAAPLVLEANKKLLSRRLSHAQSEISDLQSQRGALEKQHSDDIREVRETLSLHVKQVSSLAAKVKIADEGLGHAYNRGMHDRIKIESDLEGARQKIIRLEDELSKLKATAANKEKENKAACAAQELANAEMARALFVRRQADQEILDVKLENSRLDTEISKLKASASNKEKENKAAHEAQQISAAEMARALFIRRQADQEIIDVKNENSRLEAEISKLKTSASNKEKENKAAHEAQQLATAEMARALLVRNQVEQEILHVKESNSQLQAQVLKLQTTLAASKSALCAAEVAKAEASVEMSRALYIRQHAEREVAETRKINDKLLLDNDRLRKQIERNSIRQPTSSADHTHETRAMKEKNAAQALVQPNVDASLILKGASEDALLWSNPETQEEQLARSYVVLPSHLRGHPGGIALATLVRKLRHDISNGDIVRLFVELLPLSACAVLGSILNIEIRGFSKTANDSSLSSRWDSAPESIHIFLRELLMTSRQRRNSSSELRLDAIRARYLTIISIVSFTLDPSDARNLQRPIAQLLLGGQIMKLHHILNYMGVCVSHPKHQQDAASRRMISHDLLLLSLNAWRSVCEDGEPLCVRFHLDNIDSQNIFHCLLGGLTRLDPRSRGVFTQKRLIDISYQLLFQKDTNQAAAVHKQFKISLGIADAAMKETGANELVARLMEDSDASSRITKELENDRSQKRPGGRRSSQREDMSEVEHLQRSQAGSRVTAIKDLVVQDYFGCDCSIRTGDNLFVIESYPARGLAIVQKGDGIRSQTAWVETAVFMPIDSGVTIQESGGIINGLPTWTHIEPADLATADERRFFEDEVKRCVATDEAVVSAVNEALLRNVHLPRSRTPCSSQIVGIFDGLASNRHDCDAALNHCMHLVRSVDPNARVLYSADGQPFGAEQKYRDALRKRHQSEVDKFEHELSLDGLPSDERERLQYGRKCAEDKRDAVSDLCPVELGTLHTEFAGVRALFKMYSDAAFRGLCDRMGLGHAFDHIASCSSGYLSLGLEFLYVVQQAWLMELIFINTNTFSTLAPGVSEFISLASRDSMCMRVYHRVLFTDPAAVLNLRSSDRMRGREAKDLQGGAQKDTALVVAAGGCPNYIRWLAWALRQEHTSTPAYQSLLVLNPTTHITETGQNLGQDEHLETNMIKGAVDGLGNVHKSNVVARGAETNYTLGCTFRVEEDLMPTCTARSRAQLMRGEHKAKLNKEALTAVARSAIRRYISPVIESELRKAQDAFSGTRTPAATDSSSLLSIPRIPTRAEEEQKANSRTAGRSINPQFLQLDELSLERVLEVAKWALRREIGGSYDVPENLKAMLPITYFTRERKEALSRMKKNSSKLEAIVAILSNDPGAKTSLETPRSLFSFGDGTFNMNSGTKSNIRTAFQQVFRTCRPMSGASAWFMGAENSRIRRGSIDSTDVIKIGHLILDAPFLLRLLPRPEPLRGGKTITGAEVVFNVLAWLLKPLLKVYRKVSYVEDLGGELAKMPLEQKRDDLRMKKGDASLSSIMAAEFRTFTLDTVFEETPNVASLYGDRSWRLLWQSALGEVLTDDKWRRQLQIALGDGVGVVTFSGVGSSPYKRQCTLILSPSPVGEGRLLQISAPSKQKEDTQCLFLASESLQEGIHTEIRGEDTDFIPLGLLTVDGVRPSEGVARIGKLFVHTSSREVIEKDGTKFKEEIFCCNDLAGAIRSIDSLASLNPNLRVASIVALMILLGGDTTSYMYIPYVKALNWFLLHAAYIGSLVRVPTELEARSGKSLMLDMMSIYRLFKTLYICLNSAVVPGWKSMLPSESARAVDSFEYEELEKRIAREVFPRVQRFMPSINNLKWHTARAQQRLQTWDNARLLNPRHVRLTGFAVVMRPRPGMMLDDQEKRIEEPTLEEIEANEEWLLMRVEPIVERVNRTLAWLFGGDDPAQLLLNRKKTRTRNEGIGGQPSRKDELLKVARERLRPESKVTPTVAQMQAVVIAYKSCKGASRREISELRKGMKGKAATLAAFEEMLRSCSVNLLPWNEMGAPEELPLGLGYAQIEDEREISNECDVDENEGEIDGGIDIEVNSDDESDDEDIEALGDVLDDVVAFLGEGADEYLHAVDSATTAEEVCDAIESGLRRGIRQRAPPERMDL